MHNPEEQFKTESARVRLLTHEKQAIRQQILAETPLSYSTRAHPSPFGWALKFVAIPLVLLLLIGGPVTYAAQTSAPGDLLYEFELWVVEPVEGSFYFGPAAQIDFHTSRLEERLDELKETPTLDELGLDSATQNIEEHVEELAASLASTTEPTDEKIKHLVRFKALTEAHGEILEDLSAETETLESFAESVEEELADTSEEYLAHTSEGDVEVDISETVIDLGELASTTDTTTEISIREQILTITNAVEEGNFEEALDLAYEIQVEMLKQQYLSSENEED